MTFCPSFALYIWPESDLGAFVYSATGSFDLPDELDIIASNDLKLKPSDVSQK